MESLAPFSLQIRTNNMFWGAYLLDFYFHYQFESCNCPIQPLEVHIFTNLALSMISYIPDSEMNGTFKGFKHADSISDDPTLRIKPQHWPSGIFMLILPVWK